jgi:hypothetical protein
MNWGKVSIYTPIHTLDLATPKIVLVWLVHVLAML